MIFRKYCRLMTAGLFTIVLVLPGFGDEVPEIPPGTSIKVRIIDQLSSEESETGDIFPGDYIFNPYTGKRLAEK